MRDRPRIIDEAADALADGVAVDWNAAGRRARSLHDRAVLRSLEMISSLGLSGRDASGSVNRARPAMSPDNVEPTPATSPVRPRYHGLARRVLLALVGLPLMGLGAFELLQDPSSLHDVASHPVAAAVAALSCVAALVLLIGDPLPWPIGRAFERRRRPDAVVAAVTSHIRDAADERELTDRVEPIVATALCVQPVRLLVADEHGVFVHPRRRCASLSRDSALVASLGDDDDGVAWDGDRSRDVLPPSEQAWLESGAFVALAPLRARTGRLLGMLAIGGAEDALPLDLTDLDALRAVACPIALVLEQVTGHDLSGGRAVEDRPAAQCRECGSVLAAAEARCGCGGQTDTAALPQVVAGKFRIDRRLGVGAMGVAYLGRDLSLGRPVVVKALQRRSSATTRQLAAEAQAMAVVTHPSLAGIFALETWRGVPLLVMEFVPGGTLADRLRDGPLRPAVVLDMGRTLAGGLEALHAAGLHHNDVKPANIAVGASGLPKLLDFGLAGLAAADFDEEALAGTPLYLSPEGLAGRDVAESGDLWALAMVLYESIAGVHPFAGGDVADVLAQVRAARVPDIRMFCPDGSPLLARLFSDLLSTTPERRPATASELGTRLGAVARALAAGGAASGLSTLEIPPEQQSGHTWLAVSGGPALR